MSLESELLDDPEGFGYAGMTDQQATNSLNGLTRSQDVAAVTSADIFDAIVPAEYPTDAGDKALLSDIFSLSEIRVQGNTRDVLLSIFGPGTTRNNLADLQTIAISRAAELGLPPVKFQHVWEVRR